MAEILNVLFDFTLFIKQPLSNRLEGAIMISKIKGSPHSGRVSLNRAALPGKSE